MSESGGGSGNPSDLARMRGKAIKLLAGREHSEKELLQKLARASARSAQRERSTAQRKQKAAQSEANRAAQTSLDNGFDEPEENSGRFASKNGQFAPQVSVSAQPIEPLEPIEQLSARERARPAAENAAAVLESLKADGFQSDRRYAESITRHFAGRMSKSAIAGKLKAAGVDRDEIEDAMAQALGEEHTDDFTVAQEIWQSKFRNPPADDKEKAKQVRFLQSRGFSISMALKVIKAAGSPTDEF
jgi:regulatory protein